MSSERRGHGYGRAEDRNSRNRRNSPSQSRNQMPSENRFYAEPSAVELEDFNILLQNDDENVIDLTNDDDNIIDLSNED